MPFALLCANTGVALAAMITPISQTSQTGTMPSTLQPNQFMTPATFNTIEPFLTTKMADALRPSGAEWAPNPSVTFARSAIGAVQAPVSKFSTAFDNPPVNTDATQTTAPTRPLLSASSGIAAAGSAQRVAGAQQIAAARAATPQQAGGSLPPVAQQGRRVVARSGINTMVARSAAPMQMGVMQPAATQQRRVVARAAIVNPRSGNTPYEVATALPNVSTNQCMADYAACMNGYCQRDNTPYNRCYCSPQLAQIDAELRPAIDDIVSRLAIMKAGGNPNGENMTDQEWEDYWQQTFGQYTDQNNMAALNSALNINWMDTESSVRGQNAFITGHEYCIQHLVACAYMSSNLRDAYRSDIARDCAAYRDYLTKIKTAGQTILSQFE